MFIVTAFILGLLATALNPCQIAINVSALTYLSNKSKNNGELIRKGIFYSIGRMTTYTVLGLVLLVLWQKGIDTQSVNKLLSRGEDLLPYILLLIGMFMLYRVFHHHEHHGDECHDCGKTINRSGPAGAFILGLMLAFAFCPESAIIYFGMMMPLAATHSLGALAPPAFALASAIPVVLIVYLMATASRHTMTLSLKFRHFQKIANALIGTAFIVTAIILLIR